MADVIILGAGVVGVCAALHLQARGRAVALIDRRGAAGLETSYGNAGLIERSTIVPYFFPRDPAKLVKYALNLLPEAHYHVSALPLIAPWLVRYYRESAADRIARNAASFRSLIERSVEEHDALIAEAGAGRLLRKAGWIKVYRSARALDAAASEADALRDYGLHIDTLDAKALAAREPDLAPLPGAIHYRDSAAILDPGALSQAYADLFLSRGGRQFTGEARSLTQESEGSWRVETADGPLLARAAVIALGPWSNDVFRPLGYRLPLGVKRGYHMHYALRPGARLNHPVLDADAGYLLAPMMRGVRLTTGAEFARRDAAPTPVQLEEGERLARTLAPLGARLDAEPWLGARPCLPDMLPVIGPAPRHKGLWFNFGHAHHGLTLAAVTGRLLADMMTGETPFLDPGPYCATRF